MSSGNRSRAVSFKKGRPIAQQAITESSETSFRQSTERSEGSTNFKKQLAAVNFNETPAIRKQSTRRYSIKRETIDAKSFLSLQKYNSNSRILKEFIQSNFRDDELIDYETLHNIEIRNNSNLSYE